MSGCANANPGRLVSRGDLLSALARLECDRDETGAFRVGGPISSFMGAGEEFAIGDSAVYMRDGSPRPLAAALAALEIGLSVTVL